MQNYNFNFKIVWIVLYTNTYCSVQETDSWWTCLNPFLPPVPML